MIYILQSSFETQANWHRDFFINLELEFRRQQVNVQAGEDLEKVQGLTPDDHVFVTHYSHLESQEVKTTKAKVVYHHHGSSANPYTHWIDKAKEIRNIEEVIDIHTFCMPTQEKLIREKFHIEIGKTIGFPVNFDTYIPYSKIPKKKKIVVAGHIGPERQFYLATYLLKDLMPEYEVVFSIIEKPDCSTGQWSSFYDLPRFEEIGFKFVYHPDQKGFYEELADASHIFTCSLGDTFSLSVLEGALIGATPIVPRTVDWWGQYPDYVDHCYSPFDKDDGEYSVESFIRYWHPKVDTKWFDSKLVVERLLEVLC